MFSPWFFVTISATFASGINIISRDAWGARPLKTNQALHVVLYRSMIQHDCSNITKCKATVKSIQAYHMDTNKWCDIGYNFLIGMDGTIYEGKGWSKWEAHSPGFNKNSIEISLMGNYQREVPIGEHLLAARNLIDYGLKNNFISNNYKLFFEFQQESENYSNNEEGELNL